MNLKCLLLYTFLLLQLGLFSQFQISIHADENLRKNTILKHCLSDLEKLCNQSFSSQLIYNQNNASVQIFLPSFDQLKSFTKLKDLQKDSFSIQSKSMDDKTMIYLKAKTFKGVSDGIYALLQEGLQLEFIHPEKICIPAYQHWPLSQNYQLKGIPKFNKMGFHLHTQHPIELMDAFMNPKSADHLNQIKRYIDWLARNQQNYFEFCLLEIKNMEEWVKDFKSVTKYAHERGIYIGLDFSLHMRQQNSFKLYQNFPISWQAVDKQIAKNLNLLSKTGVDLFNIERSQTEFSAPKQKKILKNLGVVKTFTDENDIELFSRIHVVPNSIINKKDNSQNTVFQTGDSLSEMLHTVMFYDLQDESAPVYGNKNFSHLLTYFIENKDKKELWYYPESSYWITFDHSIPNLFLNYLESRKRDIDLMYSLQAEGHLTFSSGWEWGYSLIDWKIARWSWDYSKKTEAEDLPQNWYANKPIAISLDSIQELHHKYIKNKELIRYMSAATFLDELPRFLFKYNLQPRPTYTHSFLMNKALPYHLDSIEINFIQPLKEFHDLSLVQTQILDQNKSNLTHPFFEEFFIGLRVTELRALFKSYLLEAIVAYRRTSIEKQKDCPICIEKLNQAEKVINQAEKWVKLQEKKYKYPVKKLAGLYTNPTSYDYGYLYPVTNLHFWRRELDQIRLKKFSPFYKNIFDLLQIIGLKS